MKFKLLPETLYLIVNIIDRYAELTTISRQAYQLVAIAALLVACKYEEIQVPDLKSLSLISDSTYTSKEILVMESSILSVLNFNITIVSSYKFLERYARLMFMDSLAFSLANYILELSLVDYKMLKYPPSHIAAASIYLTNKLYNSEAAWPLVLNEESPYMDSDLRACARDLCVNLQGARLSVYQALFKKYSLSRYNEVAKMVF